jgi:hypothetical protein
LRAAGSRSGERRDYPQLAPLVGLGRERYQRLSPPEQRMARLEIDRELALRREMRPALGDAPAAGRPQRTGAPSAAGADAGAAGMHHSGVRERARRTGSTHEGDAAESSVMRDAREVAARRKRQLGLNRP